MQRAFPVLQLLLKCFVYRVSSIFKIIFPVLPLLPLLPLLVLLVFTLGANQMTLCGLLACKPCALSCFPVLARLARLVSRYKKADVLPSALALFLWVLVNARYFRSVERHSVFTYQSTGK